MPESFFKVAFAATFLVASAIGATTARRASRHHGTQLNQLGNEARGLVAIRALLGLIFYASLAAWMLWPSRMRWSYIAVPAAMRVSATVLMIPLLVFFAWSFRTLGTSYRGGVGLYERHQLVTRGPYARMRHPIYAAFTAIMMLVLLTSANWVLGLSGILLVISIAIVRIPIEEDQLRARFGPSWDEYARRTGRLLPRLTR